MNEYNYDSYCGIYCGACDIHMAHKTGYKDKLALFWSMPTLKMFLRAQGSPYNENEDLQLKCHGCKSDTLFINCRNCKIRDCAIGRKVEHCIDCGDFPCEMYNGLKKMKALLPHIKLNQSNMETIKKAGVNQWLADQEKQWKCPECQTGFAWYSRKCRTCGKDLKDRSFKFSFVRSAILKLGVRLSSLKRSK